jgi:hypothetical protein
MYFAATAEVRQKKTGIERYVEINVVNACWLQVEM